MADRIGPRCGNNPNFRMSDGDQKAVDDFQARLALQAAAKPYIADAVWVDGDPLMEVIAVTLWERCARDDKDMPQAVCDDPRTIAAFAAAVARAHAAGQAPATDRECAASISGGCLREAQSETACDSGDGECVYGGKPATDQTALRDRIAEALYAHDHPGHLVPLNETGMEPAYRESADSVLAVLPASVDRAAVETAAPVKQRADLTEAEWAEQERARFERLYTRETVRADLAEQRADTAARDADIYQKRLERLGEGYTRERKRAEAMEHAMESTAADALAHRGCHRDLMAQCLRAERAEAEVERLRTDQAGEFTAADLVAALRGAGAERDKIEAQARATTDAEDPARIDRLRPEFFEHASVEAIDSQIRRAQTQQRQWENRARTLAILRQARVKQKELGEWPAVEAKSPKETQPSPTEELLVTRCDACRHTLNRHHQHGACTVVLCVCGTFQYPVEELPQ